MHREFARSPLAMAGVCGAGLIWGVLATADDVVPQSPWQVTLGAGVGVRPEFPGSDSNEVRPVPAVEITYDDRWFLGRDGLGAYVTRGDRWLLSASVAPDMTRRDESDSPHLRGLGDVDRTAVALLRTSYRFSFLTATAAVSTDVGDQGHGTLIDLLLQANHALMPRWSFNYGIAARWANDEYTATFFGIDAQQSERSGLPGYETDAGLNEVRAFIGANYFLSPQWMISGGMSINQLRGDAQDSPITQDDTYGTANAVVLYRF